MIVGVGIDLLEVDKIKKDIESNAYLHKVFSALEIAECKSILNSAERFAGTFAAKEAFMKAIGKGIRQEVWFAQIEVLDDENGRPHIQSTGEARASLVALNIKTVHISITHTKHDAVAVVILET